MNYLPFDLETALKNPERVVTLDGRKVTELHHFKSKETLPLVIIIDGLECSYNLDGSFNSVAPHSMDLFLLPEVKKVWVNVYETEKSIWVGGEFPTKVKAIDGINEDCGKYIKTICITNEPE